MHPYYLENRSFDKVLQILLLSKIPSRSVSSTIQEFPSRLSHLPAALLSFPAKRTRSQHTRSIVSAIVGNFVTTRSPHRAPPFQYFPLSPDFKISTILACF